VYPNHELHVVLENVSTHKTPEVPARLERDPRITLHFAPASASLMNRVETWFGILTRKAIRRGSFRSVKELVARRASGQSLANLATSERLGEPPA
jgi:transposase